MALHAIGDVHGCVRTLAALLDRIGPGKNDHVVFVGDYVDRGPDSRGVVDLLLSLPRHTGCTFLRGNHEALLLACFPEATNRPRGDRETLGLWTVNGGEATLASYPGGAIPDEHLAFLRATVLHHATPDAFFVHAGLNPALTIDENVRWEDEGTFLWTRAHLAAPAVAWEQPVVCGHTPQAEPIDRERLLMIDTGCVYHERPGLGRLCAVRLPERAFTFEPYQG